MYAHLSIRATRSKPQSDRLCYHSPGTQLMVIFCTKSFLQEQVKGAFTPNLFRLINTNSSPGEGGSFWAVDQTLVLTKQPKGYSSIRIQVICGA